MAKKTIGGVVTNFIYNVEDRLIEVRDGSDSLIASYYYDPFGRRLWKEVGGTRTYFIYSDEGLIGEYDAIGKEIKTYGYMPGATWTTDPLFMKEGGDYYFYQNDHLGTPQKMAGVNGGAVWSAKYSSFGEATVDGSSNITNNLRFPGQYFDEETGLHYNYHRYYDPMTARYLRTDPLNIGTFDIYAKGLRDWITGKIVEQSFNFQNYKLVFPVSPLFFNNFFGFRTINKLLNNPQEQNAYVYVLNNPANLFDTLGYLHGLTMTCQDKKILCKMLCFPLCMVLSEGNPIIAPICYGMCYYACESAYGECICSE